MSRTLAAVAAARAFSASRLLDSPPWHQNTGAPSGSPHSPYASTRPSSSVIVEAEGSATVGGSLPDAGD
jgi:hypothetical protein